MKKNMGILVIVSFILMVLVNALANILPINNITTGEVSDLYPNLFVPTPITFSIWGVIYLLLLFFVIYQSRNLFKGIETPNISMFFVLSCFANTLWIFAWHYQQIFLSLVFMVILFFLLLLIYLTLQKERGTRTRREWFFLQLPFSVYFSWITVATIANVTAFLVSIGLRGEEFTQSFWTVVLILIASFIGVLMLLRRKDIPYNLVIIWALLGIIINRIDSQPIYFSIIIAAIAGIILILLAAYQLYQKGTLFRQT